MTKDNRVNRYCPCGDPATTIVGGRGRCKECAEELRTGEPDVDALIEENSRRAFWAGSSGRSNMFPRKAPIRKGKR